jgi:tetratricopeptide (TPR) repeat protein
VSTLWWQDLDPRDRRPWTAPEIAAEMTSADFRAGRDPALEAVLRWRPQPVLEDRMLVALGQGDTARAFARYRAYRDDPRHAYADTDRLLQQAARRAAQAGRLADALAIAQLNVREHPRSSDAEAYLAEGYARAGQKDLAIAGFERAIALDPTNSFALTRLSELRGGS